MGRVMTEIIVRGRQGGKTTELIRRAAESHGYIVCADRRQARWIAERAREMGADIPFPMSASEFFGAQFYQPGCRAFLFDNLDQIIQQMSHGVPVIAATWTAEDETPDPAWMTGARPGPPPRRPGTGQKEAQ
jgi:hypothetical protein